MNSHELARLLLARRDNDIRVRTEIDNDADETDAPELYDTAWVTVEGLSYDEETDCLVIQAGTHYGSDYES